MVAFLHYNFAPSILRRDIGILGFLHKRILGLCHPAIVKFLPRVRDNWHTKQLDTHQGRCISRNPLYERSLFNSIGICNRLPQYVVNTTSVKAFQKELTQMA